MIGASTMTSWLMGSTPEWLELQFSAAEISQSEVIGVLADPDGDGIPNLLEFGFVGLPLEKGPAALIRVAIESIGDDQYFTLTFERPVDSELQYVLQRSNNLLNWDSRPLNRVRASVDMVTQVETLTVREKQRMAV
ncbi:hypothetical protein OAF44_01425 [Akkermansiaceae bacterium]|nr:hypothetical protein [Akkermansiaceae bacterium]